MKHRPSSRVLIWALAALGAGWLAGCSSDDGGGSVDLGQPLFAVAETGYPEFASPQAQSVALSNDGSELYVANTAADTLDVIDTSSRQVVRRVPVGIDPVSVAVRPDGTEVWVSNHVSDSVSVVDTAGGSDTRYHVVATVQAFTDGGMVTDFDEPVGVAFADDTKAYVLLSSRNRLAVIDVASREVTKQIQVHSQDPRAIKVRDGRLFVIPFESGNQTELSGCFTVDSDPRCTFPIFETLASNSLDAILTRNFVANIVRNPAIPDRDLFVYDTATDEILHEVSTIGTLLYGVAVDSAGLVYISLAEARNDANGIAGDELVDLENRAFLNQIAVVDCTDGCSEDVELIDLEPLPPLNPEADNQFATPFGIEVSADDATIVSVASSSNRLFTMDARSGAVLGTADLGGVPRSLALESDDAGSPSQAWVLNAVENSVSLVDLSDLGDPVEIDRIALDDPTHPEVKAGRLAFNDALGSTSGTFSCESCHPDGHTDQLLWNLGAVCITDGCDQAQPRSTMPIRGLRDTLPLHWDGVPADPFGGINAEVTGESGLTVEPNCTDEHSCFRHLVDGSMSGTMCDVSDCPVQDDGLVGALTAAERDAMAVFLRAVPYPPTRSRRLDDQFSDLAFDGFRIFLIGNGPDFPGCSRTGVCHTLPFWAGTNTPGTGFDAPTFRGIPDRFLLTPNGRQGLWEVAQLGTGIVTDVEWDPNHGPDELYVWGIGFGTELAPLTNRLSLGGIGPFELFQLFDEGSTGFSGVFGRQVTLNERSVSADALTRTLMLVEWLELADSDGVVNLRAAGRTVGEELALVFEEGEYYRVGDDGMAYTGFTRDQLIAGAQDGSMVVTLTARLGANVDVDHPQPALWLPSKFDFFTSPQLIPELEGEPTLTMFGRHVPSGSIVLIDGRAVDATVRCESGGTLPTCDEELLRVDLASMPAAGDHTIQIAAPEGLISNEVLMIVN